MEINNGSDILVFISCLPNQSVLLFPIVAFSWKLANIKAPSNMPVSFLKSFK